MPTLSIRRLFDLQELDLQAVSDEQSLADVRTALNDDSEAQSLSTLIENAVSRLSESSNARRQVESEVQRLSERLAAAERRLYGGGVTNARELSASEEERSAVLLERAAEEDKLLELMVGIEELESTRDRSQAGLADLKARRIEDLPKLQAEEERLVGEVDKLREARQVMLPEFPATALAVYETVRSARNGQAIVRVERGMCQGCRITLPESEWRLARSSQGIVQCNSCQRILYVV